MSPRDKLKETKDYLNEVHHRLYIQISEISDCVKKRQLANDELVDVGFLFREIESIFDELRKEAKARKELSAKVLALSVIQESVNDPEADSVIHGEYARASLSLKTRVRLPKKLSPEYYEVCEFLGVPSEVIDKGLVKLDWNGASEFATQMAEEGKRLPKGLDDTYQEYSCTYTRKTPKQ